MYNIYIHVYIYERLYYIYINIMYDTCKYISSFLSYYEKLDLFYEPYEKYVSYVLWQAQSLSSKAGKIYHTIIYKNYYSVVLYIIYIFLLHNINIFYFFFLAGLFF